MAIKGHHFFKMTRAVMEVERFKGVLEGLSRSWEERVQEISDTNFEEKLSELKAYRSRVLADIRREYRRLHKDFQIYVEEALVRFETAMDEIIAQHTATPTPG
jgi:hypothetical protein